MKTEIVAVTALVAAMLALPSQAGAPQEQAPQARATLMLAQAKGEATCEQEGRRVPQGTTYCERGRVVRCTPRGRWEKTGKSC